jgi:hypothetical protein
VRAADQHVAVGQRQDRAHQHVGRHVDLVEALLRGVQPLQVAASARHPHASVRGLRDRVHRYRSERGAALRIDRVVAEAAAVGVVAVEPAGLRADPQPAFAVHAQHGDVVVGQAAGRAAVAAEDAELLAVETVQAVLRADPQHAFAILRERPRRGLRQALLDPQPLQPDADQPGRGLRRRRLCAERFRDPPDQQTQAQQCGPAHAHRLSVPRAGAQAAAHASGEAVERRAQCAAERPRSGPFGRFAALQHGGA